jgi:hypothetical protein
LVPAGVIEAKCDHTHALPTHVGEVHRRAGFVALLGHDVLVGRTGGGNDLTDHPRRLMAASVVGSLPTASLDHPAIAHKRALVIRDARLSARLLTFANVPNASSMKLSRDSRCVHGLPPTGRPCQSVTGVRSFQFGRLAQMWTQLAEEAQTRRATVSRAQDTFNEGQIVHQQEQVQPKKADDDQSF